MSRLNYERGVMAGLVLLVFFAGRGMAYVDTSLAVVASGLVVGAAVAVTQLILRSVAQAR